MLACTGCASGSGACFNQLRTNCKQIKGGRGRLKTSTRISKEQLWLLINPQEQGREASEQSEPTLQGPPVDYSGKDKLPVPRSIPSSLCEACRHLKNSDSRGKRGAHKGRRWVAWTMEIKNHRDIDAVLAFSTLSLNNKPLKACATRFPWKSHSVCYLHVPEKQISWKCYLLPSGF